MIRMNKRQHALAAEETNVLLVTLDPHNGGTTLRMLVEEARMTNGPNPFREHDLQVLIVRRANGNGGTLTEPELQDALDELEAMG